MKCLVRRVPRATTETLRKGKIVSDHELLKESADELCWMHRAYMKDHPMSEGMPRVIRLIQKIESATGHKTAGPYPDA